MSFVDRWIETMPDNFGPLPGKDEEAIALQGAEEGMVLLKNGGSLPLKAKKVALFGAGAADTIICGTGSGSIVAPYQINVEQGLREDGFVLTSGRWLDKFADMSKKANEKTEGEIFFKLWGGGTVLIDEPEITEDELAEAASAPVAVYVIRRNTGEGYDRKDEKGDFRLSDRERENLEKVAGRFEKTVVVLNTSVMDPRFIDEIPGIDAALLMNLPGMLAGRALANILTGKTTPSGKLADTWAKRYADYPTSSYFSGNDGNTLEEDYKEGIYVGYRYFDTFEVEPQFCFGYGQSYTTFDLTFGEVGIKDLNVIVPVTVTNTGKYHGKEVVQVYVSAPQTPEFPKPYQELRGFAKTRCLKPGESETVIVSFPASSMASFDETHHAWILSMGRYLIRVGNSSRNTSVAAVVELDRDVVTERTCKNSICPKAMDLLSAPAVVYEDTAVQTLKMCAEDFKTVDHSSVYHKETITYVPEGSDYVPYMENNPYKLPFPTTERVVTVRNVPDATFFDVAEGKVSMEEFVASLPVGVLVRLCTGVTHETPCPVQSRMKEKISPAEAIPSSGRTTSQYVESLGIPNSYLTDGPAGVHLFGKPTAAWPVGAVLAQTWNTDLLKLTGSGFGDELEAYHQDVLLAPGMNIHRDIMGGRTFEYYSEDPLLTGKMASAFTDGVQSHEGIMVSIKHFCCNNQETDRGESSSNVSERALREIYLKGFEIAVKESDPGTIMTSYNKINGVHTSEQRELLEGIVRGEWGFKGIFMTDWHSESYKPADIHAGNDLIMGGVQAEAFLEALEGLEPVFDSDGNIEVKEYITYDGLKKEQVESWQSFLPCEDGPDTVKAGDKVYRGIYRGKHLPLGDLQHCAIHILRYLLRTLAWKELRQDVQKKS